MNCEIKKKKNSYNEWTLKLTGITEGKIIAILHSLKLRSDKSPVALDVYCLMNQAYEFHK